MIVRPDLLRFVALPWTDNTLDAGRKYKLSCTFAVTMIQRSGKSYLPLPNAGCVLCETPVNYSFSTTPGYAPSYMLSSLTGEDPAATEVTDETP